MTCKTHTFAYIRHRVDKSYLEKEHCPSLNTLNGREAEVVERVSSILW
jgi:hypothetical protein